jgi:predicted RNA methylase
LNKFRKAIHDVVKEEDYVVDIGTGSGVLAILAAKAGASRVTAIELNPESLLYARKAAQMNGVEEVIEFVEANFSEFVPDRRADVVICEMLSSMMLVEQQIPASFHATERFLKPGGVLLPNAVTIYTVPVECTEIWNRFEYEGLQFPRVVQTSTKEATKDLADMQILEELDLMNLKRDAVVDRNLQFEIVTSGTVHGLVGIFEATLTEDIHLDIDDGWKQLFIPLNQPVEVDNGDSISIGISYRPGMYDSLSVITK